MFFKKRKYDNLTDLVASCQQQDRAAQHIFYERYKRKMLGICQRYTRTVSEAEDIFQEAFIKIFKHIDELREPELADQWVKKTIIRTALTYYSLTTKKEQVYTVITEEELNLETTDGPDIISRMDLEVLLTIIRELPDGYRTIINLYLIDGYTHAEISQMLSITESTSKSQLSRGKDLLIKRIQQHGGVEYERFRKRS